MNAPFLKWAGGKRWLATSGLLPIPQSYKRYVEPFLGSAAIFFHLRPERALLSDVNEDLICLYQVMKDEPDKLYQAMRKHQRLHSKDHYYQMRAAKPRSVTQKAARFLYLNRTCWNGLYRVNLKGEFNVPIGTKDTVIFDTDDFRSISELLSGAELLCADFESVIDQCGKGDVVFVDPPYTAKHNFNGFLKYNETIFSWDDQTRLRDSAIRAVDRGAFVIVTNADHKSVRRLYKDASTYIQLTRHSVLAGDATKRTATTEALFVLEK